MGYDLNTNVCLLTDSFPPTIDGVANCVRNYADIIQRDLGQACVCTPHYPRVQDSYPYPVFRYPSVNMNRVFGYRAGVPFDRKTIHKVIQQPIDIMHAHCPIMSMLMARTLRELIHRPIVLTYHSKFELDIQQDISSPAVREQATRAILTNIETADAVWTVSEGARRSLRAMGYRGESMVMPNGVDLPRGAADEASVRQLNTELGLASDLPVFLFIGRMMWYKGIRQILDALKLLDPAGGDYRMLFVGDGQDKEEIVSYAQDAGLGRQVIFLPPTGDRERLRACYTRGDLFLFPSDYDTNGLVVHEAAACGTASVTLRDSCAAEGIVAGRNGLTVSKDPAELARVCGEMLRHPERMRDMGRHAEEELYLSWDDSVRHAYAAYADVIAAYRERRHPPRNGKTDRFFRTISRLYRIPKH